MQLGNSNNCTYFQYKTLLSFDNKRSNKVFKILNANKSAIIDRLQLDQLLLEQESILNIEESSINFEESA